MHKFPFFITFLFVVSSAFAQNPTAPSIQKTIETSAVTQQTEKAKIFTGTLSGVDPSQSTLTLSSKESASPLRYSYSDSTKFFDGDGHALTPQALEAGSKATLTYLQTGTTLVIVKGIFTKPAPAMVTEIAVEAPVTQVRKTIVVQPTPASMVEETTTTTVTQP